MKFKVTYMLNEDEVKNLPLSPIKIIPEYKTEQDDLSEEIEWIEYFEGMILSTSCDYVWDRYCFDFSDKKILPKNIFYKLIRKTLNCYSAQRRLAHNSVKYCFVSKST